MRHLSFRSIRSPLGFTTLLAATCALAAAAACGGSDNGDSVFDGGGKVNGPDGSPGGSGRDASLGGDDDSSIALGGGDGAASETVQSLSFSPSAATVTVDGTASKNVQFTLNATFADGTTSAVTPDSIELDRPDLGTLANGDPVTATAPSPLGLFGGTGTLHAIFHGVAASATLTVQVSVTDYGTGLSSTSAPVVALGGSGGGSGDGGTGGVDGGTGAGDGGTGSSLPTDPTTNISPLLYPYDQTLFPLGLTAPPIMWNAPQANDVYRLHFAEKNFVYDDYVTLSALPGELRIAQATWDKLTASNDAKNGADPIAFTLSRWDHTSQKAYLSTSASWSIAPASLAGAIFYWTTSNGGALTRIPPGAGAVPTPLTGPKGVNCMGCHAVSADGSTLVAAMEGNGIPSGPDDSRSWVSFNINGGGTIEDAGADSGIGDAGGAGTTLRELSNVPAGNLAVSPDGKYVLGGDKTLTLSDSTTAAALTSTAAIALDTNMTGFKTPAFSPSGALVAAVESGGDWQYWNYSNSIISELVLLSFDETTTTFGATAHKLVDSSAFTAGQATINYPSFSPDSNFVAYQVSDHNSGCWSFPNDCATTTTEIGSIYLQGVSSGAPVRLANLSDPPVTSDRNLALEPTFNPTARGGYFWLVFTSERSWGNMSTVQGTPDNDKKRLWVSAIDSTTGAADPSHPAFFLEGQNVTTQNMRGFWTTAACIATPGSGSSNGATTDGGATSGADGGAAGACKNGFDCCSGFCQGGVCIDPSALSCAGLGGACTTANDCCNGGNGAVACLNSVCAVAQIR